VSHEIGSVEMTLSLSAHYHAALSMGEALESERGLTLGLLPACAACVLPHHSGPGDDDRSGAFAGRCGQDLTDPKIWCGEAAKTMGGQEMPRS